jgi:[CysO sulfur-carrier protein]-S-L-cysteine hydrolase
VSFGIVVYGPGQSVSEKEAVAGSTTAELRPRAVGEKPPVGLILDRSIYDEIVRHLQTTLPAEGCGLMATRSNDGQPERVERFYAGSNLDASATSYTMDPKEVVAALKDMEARGWRLGAIVHSHPTTEAIPSHTDLQEAFYPTALMLIVSFARGTPNLRAWRLALRDGSAQMEGEATIEIEGAVDQ